MILSEDEVIEKYGKLCGHCLRNTLPPYEYEYTCVTCGYNLIKRKHELTEICEQTTRLHNCHNHKWISELLQNHQQICIPLC